jgi:hypothetical protein
MLNLQELSSLIKKAADTIEANEKFPVAILAAKARREASARPTDTHLINASQVLTKIASSDKMFISKSELANIVERFGATHSKLSSVFSEELGKRAEPKPQTFAREANEGISLDRDYQRFSDPVLANALSGAFDAKPVEKIYSPADAQRAHRAAYAQLLSIGVVPKEVVTFAGRKDIIICQANYETQMGQANVLIPVELIEGRAVLPSMFFSLNGFEDLEKTAYLDHIKAVVGKGFRVDGSKLLDVLEQVKRGSSTLCNDVELAAIKVASEQNSPAMLDQNGIYYTEVLDTKADVELPKMAETKESKFAETLSSANGIANFIHSDRVVEAGRSMLSRKFAEIGYKSVQIKVAEVEKDKIFYAVAIGTGTGFKVPIEVTGTNVFPPKIIFADGIVTAFSKEAITEAVKAGIGGNKQALSIASNCSGMKPTELLDIVKKAVHDGNYARAEDAINVLGEIDPSAQKVAIAHMMLNISESGKDPSGDISEMQKLANKPVQDTPMFMSYKIFFPEGA